MQLCSFLHPRTTHFQSLCSSLLLGISCFLWPLSNFIRGFVITRDQKDASAFIEALFTIDGTWKQPRCPSKDEWIRKLWCIHTVDYYSVMKRSTFGSVNLEHMVDSEVSQKEKDSITS